MPVGVFIDSGSVLLGGLLGALVGKYIPERVRTGLTLVLGICSMAMGIFYIVKANTLPVVVLSIILGIALGELVFLEKGIAAGIGKISAPISKLMKTDVQQGGDAFMNKFVAITVLFCASGTGIFGAIEAGMSGDNTVLITKSILDFVTATTFAATLGPLVAGICVPQCLLLLLLFFSAGGLYPHTTEFMRADFTACGGVIMLATGFRVNEIKTFPTANMLPAMILVMPISRLWADVIVPLLAQR